MSRQAITRDGNIFVQYGSGKSQYGGYAMNSPVYGPLQSGSTYGWEKQQDEKFVDGVPPVYPDENIDVADAVPDPENPKGISNDDEDILNVETPGSEQRPSPAPVAGTMRDMLQYHPTWIAGNYVLSGAKDIYDGVTDRSETPGLLNAREQVAQSQADSWNIFSGTGWANEHAQSTRNNRERMGFTSANATAAGDLKLGQPAPAPAPPPVPPESAPAPEPSPGARAKTAANDLKTTGERLRGASSLEKIKLLEAIQLDPNLRAMVQAGMLNWEDLMKANDGSVVNPDGTKPELILDEAKLQDVQSKLLRLGLQQQAEADMQVQRYQRQRTTSGAKPGAGFYGNKPVYMGPRYTSGRLPNTKNVSLI